MLLKTERLTIRPVTANDWTSIQEIWMDFNASDLSQYDRPHDTSDEAVQTRIARWAAAHHGREHIFFAICLDDTLIGYCAFNIRKEGYEIGYCFHSAYHKKGYAKESLLALFAYLGTFGITRFYVGTAMNNIPSVSLLKSLGFKLVRTESVSFYQNKVFEGGVFELNTLPSALE